MPSKDKEKDKDENMTQSSLEEEESGMEEEEDLEEGLEGSANRQHQAASGRGITLSMLMQEGLMEASENSMLIDYLVNDFSLIFQFGAILSVYKCAIFV